MIRGKAIKYMDSKPGLDNAGGNTNCHPGFYRLIERKNIESDELHRLDRILDYRQDQTRLAEDYCRALEIDSPEGQGVDQFDAREYEGSLRMEKEEGSSERANAAADKLKRMSFSWGWIIECQLFDAPLPGQGLSPSKPNKYLAAMLAESPMSLDQIHKKLRDLQQKKLRAALNAARTPLGIEILNQPAIKTLRGQLYTIVDKLKYKLPSLSPKESSLRMKGGSLEESI